MKKINKIKDEIIKLNREELIDFRKWFIQFDSDKWDKEIEEDIAAGKLDNIAKEVVFSYETSRHTSELE
jgi:hypothetical protein